MKWKDIDVRYKKRKEPKMYRIIILCNGHKVNEIVAFDEETKDSAAKFYEAAGYETEISCQ